MTNDPNLPSSSQTNGRSSTNGGRLGSSAVAGPSRVERGQASPMYSDGGLAVDKGEFVRLSIQALRDCGYTDSANTLERESGYSFDLAPIDELRDAVRGGRWEEVKALFSSVGIAGSKNELKALFLVEEQHYLELLETGQTKKALVSLRTSLAPIKYDPERLHRLSGLMLCITREELFQRSSWDGASGLSRSTLLAQLECFIPPSLSIPPRRLQTLLLQSLSHQRSQSKYCVAPLGKQTLFQDTRSERGEFPLTVGVELGDAGGEVWNLAWSRDGKRLAAGGTSRKVVVWSVGARDETTGERDVEVLTRFTAHDDPIGNLCWSPDGEILVTGAEEKISMWDTTTWELLREVRQHTELVSTIRWLPDGQTFMTSGEDGLLCKFSREGEPEGVPLETSGLRLFDFDFTPDGERLIGVATYAREAIPSTFGHRAMENLGLTSGDGGSGGYKSPCFRLVVMDAGGQRMHDGFCPTIPGEVTSFKLSQDGKTALVNRHPHEIQLWSFAQPDPKLVRRLYGHFQSQFYVRSCFAGPEDNIVISGSEDSKVYVWHRHSGELLEILRGHGRGAVNAVAWRPDVQGDDQAVFASCGDDGKVILWERTMAGQALPDRNVSDANHSHSFVEL